MSSLAQMIASGLPLAARPASVTVSASARAKLAVCSKTIWYLSAMRVEDVVDALVAVDGGAGAGLALEVEDRGAVGEGVDHGLRLGLAALDVVGADMGEDALHAVDAAVDGDDRHAGLDRLPRWPGPAR